MTDEVLRDYRLLIIIMFIFTLANWYLLVFIIARGFNRITKSIEQLKGGK